MHKGRLEAFSDGVIAILITIMVLELKVPHGHELSDLYPLIPVFISYVLSFVFIAIYWNNHHHLLQSVQKVNGKILWANCHLLFWISLIPFTTAWMGENDFSTWPVALYGVVLFFCAISYTILVKSLIAHHGPHSTLGEAIGGDRKGKVSMFLYAIAVPLAFWNSWISYGCYITVAVIWLIPDRRIEKVMER
jgi:uncharacterized membrane protein